MVHSYYSTFVDGGTVAYYFRIFQRKEYKIRIRSLKNGRFRLDIQNFSWFGQIPGYVPIIQLRLLYRKVIAEERRCGAMSTNQLRYLQSIRFLAIIVDFIIVYMLAWVALWATWVLSMTTWGRFILLIFVSCLWKSIKYQRNAGQRHPWSFIFFVRFTRYFPVQTVLYLQRIFWLVLIRCL